MKGLAVLVLRLQAARKAGFSCAPEFHGGQRGDPLRARPDYRDAVRPEHMNLFTKQVGNHGGRVAFTIIFFTIFEISEKLP